MNANIPANKGSELPGYDVAQNFNSNTSDNSEPLSSGAEDGPGEDRRKSNYAHSLQKACNFALKNVRKNHFIADSNWASPLALAPAAISTMAILLKAADQEAAAGLEIESQDVTLADGTVVGTLPSKYFHTNLQHCSDVGRLAFLDAQQGMNTIQATAKSLTSEEGSIGYIIDLLEDPEDARYNLQPEIEAIKKTANKCLASAKGITAKFEYWYLVINHLKLTSLSRKNETVKEKEVTLTKKAGAAQNKEKHQAEKEELHTKISNLEKQLGSAAQDVRRAQREVDRLHRDPVVPEPSALEEIAKVQRLFSIAPSAPKNRGGLVSLKDSIFGQSETHEKEDADRIAVHRAMVNKMQQEALATAREQRNYQRKLAAGRLGQARDYEDKMNDALNKVYRELADSNSQLKEAKANLAKAKGEMKLLSNKELELKSILEILDTSTKNLGTLKNQIEPLVNFFKTVLGEIDHQIDQNMESFLRPIVNRISQNTSNPDEIETIKLGRSSKQKMMNAALQMQGRFSAITDISTAYIAVSANYIRPAIQKMESLSTMTHSEFAIKSQEFLRECDDVMQDINKLTQQASANVEPNMRIKMDALRHRAIEAAEDRDA